MRPLYKVKISWTTLTSMKKKQAKRSIYYREGENRLCLFPTKPSQMTWVEQRRARDLRHYHSEEFPQTMSAKCRCKMITSLK